MRAFILRDRTGLFHSIGIRCPGCLYHDGRPSSHYLAVIPIPAGETESPDTAGRPHWGWNGSLEKPTFIPSLLMRSSRPNGEHVCHSFIRDGRIQFLADCTHALKGQTVDLPEIPDNA